MKVTPRNKPESLNFMLIAIDSLLYWFLGFLLFFVGPLFVIFFRHYGNRSRVELSETEAKILSNFYDSTPGNAEVWINYGLIFGIFFAILMVMRKVRRLHLIELVLDENNLILNFVSLNGRRSMKEIYLEPRSIKIYLEKSSEDADANFEIIHVKSGERIMSTKKSKYWEYKSDIIHLMELGDELRKRNFLKE